MRIRFSLTLIALAISLSACNSQDSKNAGGPAVATPPAAVQTPPSDGVRRLTIPELQAALDKGEAVVVDVRGGVEYKLGHIKGSISVPLGLIAQKIKDLPQDKLLVTYCA